MSQSILHYARMEWPTKWDKLFDRNAPLLLEIGFGTGHSLIDWATRRPDCNVIGIEISMPSLRRGAKKKRVAGMSNLKIIQADSRNALWLLFQLSSISEIVINFPDPWPKANHHHRRLISEKFLHLLATRAQEGAILNVATDHTEYAAVITDCLEQNTFFDNSLSVPFLTEDNLRYQTKYEKIALNQGRRCHYFKYRRNSNSAPDLFLIPEVSQVPHVVLSTPQQPGEIANLFEPFIVQSENINIKYLEAFQSTHEELVIIEIYVSEEPFHQRICLSIRGRKSGDMVVSIYPMGFPRPTPGLHLAIYYFVQWLQSKSSETQIVTSTLKVPNEQN